MKPRSLLLASFALAFATLSRAQERGLVHAEEGAFEGYTLFAPLRSKTTYVIDMQGNVVHTWEASGAPCSAVHLLPDGHLLRALRTDSEVFFAGGQGGLVQELDWDGAIVWELEWSDAKRMQHHDVLPLASGNVLLIAWEHKTRDEAIAAGRDPAQVDARGFWTDAVFEVEPVRPKGGRVVWSWHAWDHLIQDFDPALRGYGDVTAHPERIDVNADHRDQPLLSAAERKRQAELAEQMRAVGYVGGGDEEDEDGEGAGGGAPADRDRVEADFLHTNAVAHHAGLDLVLLSTPHLDEIWIMDRSTTTAEAAGSSGGRRGRGGDLLYRWGNPQKHGASGERRFFYQHDARWIPDDCPGAGNVLVFNNGGGRPGGDSSSVDELVLPYGSDGGFERGEGGFGPDEPLWSYRAPDPASFFSGFISGASRLPNGNTLVCAGVEGRVFEVAHDGRVVWEYRNPFAGELPSMARRPGDHPQPEGGGPPPDMLRYGMFRATRLASDHPGLARLAR